MSFFDLQVETGEIDSLRDDAAVHKVGNVIVVADGERKRKSAQGCAPARNCTRLRAILFHPGGRPTRAWAWVENHKKWACTWVDWQRTIG